MSSDVTWFPVMSSDVILCHVVSCDVVNLIYVSRGKPNKGKCWEQGYKLGCLVIY